jgi:20S proteasome subunit alpha 2
MELEDAIHVALLTLKEGFEGELNENNIEVGIVGEQTNGEFRILAPEEIKDYLNESE